MKDIIPPISATDICRILCCLAAILCCIVALVLGLYGVSEWMLPFVPAVIFSFIGRVS